MQVSVNTNSIEPLINEFILNDEYKEVRRLGELQRQFIETQYAYLPNLFTPKVFSLLKSEVEWLKQFTLARNYEPDGPGTSRNMRTFGGVRLFEESAVFSTLYVHHEIWTLLSKIVDAPIYHSIEKQDIIGLNCLVDEGNTHGWHLDEGEFILIMIFEAPDDGRGGTVEFIPNWEFYAEKFNFEKNQPIQDYVQKCSEENLVYKHYHAPGDAYLLIERRSDSTSSDAAATKGRSTLGCWYGIY